MAATATTATVVRGPLVTLRYQGAAPPPHAPCTDPTPDQMFEIELAQRARLQQQKEVAAAAQPKEESALGKIGGFFSKAAAVVDKAASDTHESAERKIREWEHNNGLEKFTINYPELVAASDKYVTSYSAAVMHMGQQITGTVFISDRHFGFASDTLKESFPLTAIASIQRSIALKTADNGPPFIMPIPAPHVLPNCVQFFLTDFRVIQLLEFDSLAAKAGQTLTSTLKGKPIDRFYNWIDHKWRAATPVPVPGVQYAQY